MDKRTQYVEKLSAQMVEWDTKIEQLKDRAQSSRPGSSSDSAQAIAALQQKRDEAALKLQGVSAASDHEWEDVKAGTNQVLGEVKSILRDAILKIK
jgi:hypothetical protein